MKIFLFTLLLALPLRASLVSESDATASINSSSISPGSNFGQGPVGFEAGTDYRVLVSAFKLPYLAPGQTITAASATWTLMSKTGAPKASLDVYGLGRVSTSNAAAITDFYIGTNDTANTRLAQSIVTSSTATGTVTLSNSALVSWVQAQYVAAGANALTPRYLFLRINGSTKESSTAAFSTYNFGTADDARPLIPTLTLTISGTPTTASDRLQFSFNAPAGSVTSAGIYSANGTTLQRTLWANVQTTTGTNYGAWDGADDFGNALTGTYTVRVLTHNVGYVWEGVVGNTSASNAGLNVWRSLGFPVGMDIAGGKGCVAVGYNEGQCAFNGFSTTAPQTLNQIFNPDNLGDPFSNFALVAYDGTMSYWAKCAGGDSSPAYTYVIGVDATNKLHQFSSGNAIPKTAGSQKYAYGFDLDTGTTTTGTVTNSQPFPATGLAVQKSGSFIFVAHGNLNVVRVFNKTTGAFVGTISVTSPGLCATDAAGNLYVLSGTSILKYAISSVGTATQAWTLSGLTAPQGLACDPSTNTVAVVDNGSVKAFNSATGSDVPTWTYGSAQTVPAVDNAHFCFSGQCVLAFAPDGSFWVGDRGNARMLHCSVNETTVSYVEQIAYLAESYQCAVDRNNPSRCFGNMLEYSQDFTKPLAGTNGSWALVNNWAVGLPTDSTHNYMGFGTVGPDSVETLSNGHRYATIGNQATQKYDVFELPPSGSSVARLTGTSFGIGAARTRIYPDGSARHMVVVLGSGGTNTYYQQALSGFDSSNNPIWSTATTLMSVPVRATGTASALYPMPDNNGEGARVEPTAGGFLPVFGDDPTSSQVYHLGMVPVNGSAYTSLSFLNEPQGLSYTGKLPTDGHFDSGNGINTRAGNVAMVYLRNVFLGFPGNYWKQSFASACYHFNEDGLMIGVFGTPGPAVAANAAVAGFAGNTLSPDVAFDSGTGTLHMWWNDESNHAGLSRWRIDNLSSINEASATGTLGQLINLTPPPSAPSGLVPAAGNSSVALAWSGVSGATSYNVLRSTSSGTGYSTISSGVSAPQYVDTSATNGTTYYYVVQAVNAMATSGNSAQVSAMPNAGVNVILSIRDNGPGQPLSVTAQSGTNGAPLVIKGN